MLGITLNTRQSIHEQLTEKITELVLMGVLEENAPMPSVRDLASELGVNPNTIQRAYSELERSGVTYSVSGKGRFVTDDVASVRKEKLEETMKDIRSCTMEYVRLGGEKEALMKEIENMYAKGAVK